MQCGTGFALLQRQTISSVVRNLCIRQNNMTSFWPLSGSVINRKFTSSSLARNLPSFNSPSSHVLSSYWRIGLQVPFVRSITLLTSFNVVDNSKLGKRSRRYKKPYLIGFYRKRRTADIGDVIKVAVQGQTSKAVVVATRKPKNNSIPRFDNNNIVLVDDNLAPLGTRIKGPVPTILRKHKDKYSKILALATRYV